MWRRRPHQSLPSTTVEDRKEEKPIDAGHLHFVICIRQWLLVDPLRRCVRRHPWISVGLIVISFGLMAFFWVLLPFHTIEMPKPYHKSRWPTIRLKNQYRSDPLFRGVYYHSWHFVRVKLGLAGPTKVTNLTTYDLRPGNAFVLHLWKDPIRWEYFEKNNNINVGGMKTVCPLIAANVTNPVPCLLQAVPAYEWTNSPEQQAALPKFPFLQKALDKKHPGDAGCSYSHWTLLQQLVSDPHHDYYFIFEDDAYLSRAFLTTSRQITLPDHADVALLISSATSRMEIPVVVGNKDTTKTAHRVIAGYGTWGYMITKSGARKLLDYLQVRPHQEIDLKIANAFGPMLVYVPMEMTTMRRPLVEHRPPANGESTRRAINDQAQNS